MIMSIVIVIMMIMMYGHDYYNDNDDMKYMMAQ